MMKALIDTNIIIDYLDDRAPLAEYAEKIIDLCEQDRFTSRDGFTHNRL